MTNPKTLPTPLTETQIQAAYIGIGSTSVPGLAAKPKIDMLLVVANSADETAYVPAMEAATFLTWLLCAVCATITGWTWAWADSM